MLHSVPCVSLDTVAPAARRRRPSKRVISAGYSAGLREGLRPLLSADASADSASLQATLVSQVDSASLQDTPTRVICAVSACDLSLFLSVHQSITYLPAFPPYRWNEGMPARHLRVSNKSTCTYHSSDGQIRHVRSLYLHVSNESINTCHFSAGRIRHARLLSLSVSDESICPSHSCMDN